MKPAAECLCVCTCVSHFFCVFPWMYLIMVWYEFKCVYVAVLFCVPCVCVGLLCLMNIADDVKLIEWDLQILQHSSVSFNRSRQNWLWDIGTTLLNSWTADVFIRMPLQVRVKHPEYGNHGAQTHYANSPITASALNNYNHCICLWAIVWSTHMQTHAHTHIICAAILVRTLHWLPFIADSLTQTLTLTLTRTLEIMFCFIRTRLWSPRGLLVPTRSDFIPGEAPVM